jgi:DNA-binding PadR family transcriptional regulator
MLELAVLGLLREQPLHGYELKKRLSETLGSLWGVSYGSLYPTLRRLEQAGAIESVQPAAGRGSAVPTGSITGDVAAARLRAMADRLATSGRRTRKAYRITERGEALFVELLLGDDDRADDDKAFALKLAFCSDLPDDARLALLERRRAALQARLDGPRRSRTDRGGRPQDRYLRSLVEHRARTTVREIEWIDELIQMERAAHGDAAPAPRNSEDVQEGAPA